MDERTQLAAARFPRALARRSSAGSRGSPLSNQVSAALKPPQAVFPLSLPGGLLGRWSALIGSWAFACAAFAVEDPPPARGQVFVSFDNDIFLHKDSDYTNGVSVGWTSAPAAGWSDIGGFGWTQGAVGWIPGFDRPGTYKAVSVDVMQTMFTPEDLTLDPPDPTDRPYCGVGLATIGFHDFTALRLMSLDLSLGVVGPASGAAATQSLVHTVTGSDQPEGWDSQIGNGLLINLACENRWRTFSTSDTVDSFGADGGLGVTPMLGSYRTSLLADIGIRLGYRMTSATGTMTIRPGSEGRLLPTSRQSPWGFHVGLMLAGEAVLHDVSLDGRVFSGDETGVDKQPLVGRLAAIAGGHAGRFQAYLLLTFSSPTFEQEHERSHYGRIIGVWTL